MTSFLNQYIKHSRTVPKEVENLLSNITIGTNGAKYCHLHTSSKIHHLYKPHFIYIKRHEKAIANVTVCERPIFVKNEIIDSYYVRYFAFSPLLQTKNISIKKTKRHTFFDTYLKAIFSSSTLNPKNKTSKASLFWAYIDPINNRSLQMGERFGFETIGYFKTYGFSRFFPKKQHNVQKITTKDKPTVLQLLKTFYKDYSFYSTVHLFKNNDYYILKHKGKIVAGIQIHKVLWRIDAMPGFKGKLTVKTLPYIPLIKRVINPKKFHFLAVDHFFWLDEYKNQVPKLLEGVLALTKHHSMLMWIDDADDFMIDTITSFKLGLLHKIKSDNSIQIVAKFNHFDPVIKQSILDSKKYISGFDTT
jgi:hypothetical protein